jgi:hypothetical protein
LLPTSRPDVDNYIKAGLDSLNGIVVRDDSQIVEITARKRFSIVPKLVMTVFPLDAGCSNRGAKKTLAEPTTQERLRRRDAYARDRLDLWITTRGH